MPSSKCDCWADAPCAAYGCSCPCHYTNTTPLKDSIRGYFSKLEPPGPQPPYKLLLEDVATLASCGIATDGYIVPDPFQELYELLDQLKEVNLDEQNDCY